MNPLPFLLLLVSLVSSAILGQNVFTLSRLLEYRLEFSSGAQNIVEFATLAPTMTGCAAGHCFYGWINNYTVGNQTFTGFDRSITNNPLFYVKLDSPNSFTLTSNNTLQPQLKKLVDVTARLLLPFYQIYSNIGIRNDLALYEFVPFDLQGQNGPPNPLAGQFNLSQLPDSFQTSTNILGWRVSDPKSDVMLHNSPMNCLLVRQMNTEKGTVNIQMTNKSIFQDMEMFSKIVVQLSADSSNVVSVALEESSLFPSRDMAALFQ